MEEKKKGIGLIGLIGMVISSCIGSGVFAITGQLAGVASPGAVLIAWLIVGVGFLALAFSLNNLTEKRSDLHGIFSYADAGWGPLAGFISGWGYWLSAWLGNVAFATMMMSTIGYFYPAFLPGNTIPCIIIASIVMWALTYLVIRGVESAAFLNAIVMVCKVAAIAVTLIFGIFLFNAGIFTADFWGNVYDNAVAAGQYGPDAAPLGGVGTQIFNCMIIMMWCFVGIEGASVVSSRAARKTDVGKATLIGFICLMLIYVGASVLPYGYMSSTEVAVLDYPALVYVFSSMAPGWGGPFISIAIIISILGSWLSFTILPAETTSEMADYKLLPASWGKLNSHNAPSMSLLIVGACTQAFLIILLFSADAYDFAFSMCTVAIVITWAFAAAYQAKWGVQNKNGVQAAIGFVAVAFQVIGVLFNGWSFLLLTCVGYIPGFFIYVKARKDYGNAITTGEKVCMGVISALGVLSLVLLAMGVISI
ncbi:basic amino acid/polyamine antiporter [Adlercreutzia equolifaciens]|uniref:basic amino acid/polyamine antiporter n=1 Tax=Adlercreutzia rubneri TaxID=2916441 RepID=UPI001D066905|nr:basic amino acid/polyamine antiporter [Adlercreutzia rubneri]MCB6759455.1 basic amino acid/polyamine antiporter [Adlercreutzia equolifaciens]MCB6975185.1 basic amino acid/polyamine antiporter [Adlercreutzia equolifaciens]MDE8683600.1 basic amino acid/polyamine antiporter [Adlercreutzia rubneri]